MPIGEIWFDIVIFASGVMTGLFISWLKYFYGGEWLK